MAFVYLSVHCELSGADFVFDETPTDPVEEWSERIANYAIQQGWLCNEDGQVIFPTSIS